MPLNLNQQTIVFIIAMCISKITSCTIRSQLKNYFLHYHIETFFASQ